ncbi:MAG: atpC [Patescibacteria group bacterium]|jgi:F-type H+-transporting ATPase subunit epsilon|nr:atpC [Patescibacteria group bacterium]
MGREQKIAIQVIAEKGVLYSGDVDAVFVPTAQGELAIMPFHIPLIALLAEGPITIKNGRTRTVVATVKRGVVHVSTNKASIVANG